MNDRLIIIGASGHGKVVADIAKRMDLWSEIFFLDDNEQLVEVLGIQIIGKTVDSIEYISTCDFFIGIGENKTREKIQSELEKMGASIPVLIHPAATIGDMVDIGFGTVIMAGVIINCCTKIGKGCIVNTASTIDHDNCIENYVHVSPGVHLAGNVSIGRGSWIAIGSSIINNIHVSNNCIVGAGAVVTKDISVPGIYIGIPARRM
jgi:sugar O-acyltransferase (sialic acid O-acetyltransferase NeuD family)